MPDSLTPEQFAKKLGISRKRHLELHALAQQAMAATAAERAKQMGITVPQFFEYMRNPDARLDSMKSNAEPSRFKRARQSPKGSPRAAKREVSLKPS